MEEQYISIDDVATELSVTRGTVHYYVRTLKLQTKKFPLDRRAYLSMKDFETIKTLKEQAGKRGPKEDAA
jgi:hypothetical protein